MPIEENKILFSFASKTKIKFNLSQMATLIYHFLLKTNSFMSNGFISICRRRRRRRRCDTTSCLWIWNSCSRSCGGGTQSPRITRNKGACGSCSLPATRRCNTRCCPVNCQWASWGSWGLCSVSCGVGDRLQTRSILRIASCGGSSCVGPSSKRSSCNAGCCPINCQWGNWGAFGACSATCGGGNQAQSRSVAVQPSCGGTSCSGSSTQTQSCNNQCCPVNCVWSSWSAYGLCSATCGSGNQTRSRSVAVQPSCGGTSCSGSSKQSQLCNPHCCPVNCLWGSWSAYEACSATCGGGRQTRSRSVAVQPSCGGTSCSGSSTQTQSCNNQCCPVNCVWSLWSAYGSCSATCGSGNQTRSRSVAVQPSCGGTSCSGSSKQSQSCNSQCCPVNCVWSSWSAYGLCSASCGGGNQTRSRFVAVTLSCGGAGCPGSSTQTRSCNSHCCPVNCVWGSWSAYEACSATCGSGNQTRSRSVAVQPSCGGTSCSGSSTQTQSCNSQCCPVNCVWSSWSAYGLCSASCGSGNQTRSRSVAVTLSCGGAGCSGSSTQTQSCNSHCCPVNCVWGSWGTYGSCTTTCGGGNQTRSRSVAVQPSCGGLSCSGSFIHTKPCNFQCCPINCVWGAWNTYSACSVTCGGGFKNRTRQFFVASTCGGVECQGPSNQSIQCNPKPCPVHCQWSEWSNWEECSQSCGGGTQTRDRSTEVGALHGGNECKESNQESRCCILIATTLV